MVKSPVRLAPVIMLLLALPGSAQYPETALSVKTARRFARLEALASSSAAARRLLAATQNVPRREVRGSDFPDAIGVRGGPSPAIVVDALRLDRLADIDVEILLVLSVARAELPFPIPVVEAEQAAWQKTLVFCVERGFDDPAGFGMKLARAAREEGALSDELARSAHQPPKPSEPAPTPVLKLPATPLARAGLLLHLFDKDPQRFYWAVEGGATWPPGSVRLGELEDLYALRAKEIAALAAAPSGTYAMLGGRRYPAALVRAAFLLRGTDEVERLRESLEAYDSVGLASARIAVNRWRRAAPSK